jgi:hypothetical protein
MLVSFIFYQVERHLSIFSLVMVVRKLKNPVCQLFFGVVGSGALLD